MNEENPHSEKKIGMWMLIAAWVVLLGLATVLYNDMFFEPKTSTLMTASGIEFTVEKNYKGHFFIDGTINNIDATFLVDTGATYVALGSQLAQRAKLKPEQPLTISTANGIIQAYSTRIKNLTIGPFQLKNVRAVILPDNTSTVLLGMSVLKHFHLQQTSTELVLKPMP